MRRPVTPAYSLPSVQHHSFFAGGSIRRAFALALGLLLVGATAARAQSDEVTPSLAPDESPPPLEPDDETRQWLFYANPEVGVYGHTGKGNSSSSEITGPRCACVGDRFGDLGTAISDPERSRENVLSILMGGTVGVLTPALDAKYSPRLFMDFNVSDVLTTEVNLARRGNPGPIAFPQAFLPATPVGEGVLNGIGTQVTVQHQGPQIHAGFGGSLEFPLEGDQLIRIKPAIVYSRTRLDIFAQTRRAVRLNANAGNPGPFNPNPQTLDDFRYIFLEEKRTEIYHAAGPAVEIEYLPRLGWGPLGLTVFAKAHAAYIFNDPKTKMQQCNTADGQPNECAYWKYTQDPWTYRAVAGVRIQWAPRSRR